MKDYLENKYLILGISFILGTMIFAIILSSAMKHFTNTQRTVTVKGLSEREVPADIAIWKIEISRSSSELRSVLVGLKQDINSLYSFFTNKGIMDEEITVGYFNSFDHFATGYREARAEARFQGEQSISVYSTNVDMIRKIIPQLSDLARTGNITITGSRYQDPVDYIFTNLNAIKPSMIKEANEFARQSALQFAEDSKSKLGKIKKASQGQIIINNRDDASKHIKKIRIVSTVEYYLVD
ncbi:MAG: SIMPL domain-containing protein [Brevinema sp.]